MIRRLYWMAIALWFPACVWAQTGVPDWVEDSYRKSNYPDAHYYTGYVIEHMPTDSSLADALKKIEDNARNLMAESIVVHIQSDAQLVTQRQALQAGGQFSEQIVSAYKQQISTSTNAKTAGVKVYSYYDPTTNLGYAFAFVQREELGTFYANQIELMLQRVESGIALADDLVAVGKKISAKEKCIEIRRELDEIEQFRTLYSVVMGNDERVLQTERYSALSRLCEQKKLSLEQSTRVYVTCTWRCNEYPEYENQASVVEDLIKQSLTGQDCTVVEDSESADFILTMTASAALRSDGSDAYGIISYYANVQGTLRNVHTGKNVSSFSILNDPHVYSAGKNHAVAVGKAFRLQSLLDVIMNAIMPKIRN